MPTASSPAPPDPLRELGGRNLQTRHYAGVKRAQHADRGIAQGKLRLPQRQQHIERVGKTIMQRVSAAGDPEHARSASRQAPVAVERAVIVMMRCGPAKGGGERGLAGASKTHLAS